MKKLIITIIAVLAFTVSNAQMSIKYTYDEQQAAVVEEEWELSQDTKDIQKLLPNLYASFELIAKEECAYKSDVCYNSIINDQVSSVITLGRMMLDDDYNSDHMFSIIHASNRTIENQDVIDYSIAMYYYTTTIK